MLNVFSRSKAVKRAADRLYGAVVARSRETVFFVSFAVPDTLDGRFDLLTLHAYAVLIQLSADKALGQAFIDRLFLGFDEAYREMGAGDIGLGWRMKTLAGAFYGRLAAYEAAATPQALAEALVRNLYRGRETACAPAMAAYLFGLKQHLTVTAEGEVAFGPLPAVGSSHDD